MGINIGDYPKFSYSPFGNTSNHVIVSRNTYHILYTYISKNNSLLPTQAVSKYTNVSEEDISCYKIWKPFSTLENFGLQFDT
jgi:hypothetical protein